MNAQFKCNSSLVAVNGVITLEGLDDERLLEATRIALESPVIVLIRLPASARPIIEAAAGLTRSTAMGAYRDEPVFFRDGLALYEAGGDLDNYCAAGAAMEARWKTAMPTPPGELMEQVLNAMWPHGVRRLLLSGKPCPFGLARRILSGGSVHWHADIAKLDAPREQIFLMAKIVSAVLYLNSTEGGELEISGTRVEAQAELDRLRDPMHAYALREELLAPVAATVKPVAATLALFCPLHAHRVRTVLGNEPRLTVSGFAALRDLNSPLELFI